MWLVTLEDNDASKLIARRVTVIYDFGAVPPDQNLRVVIDVPRTMGTTLYEFVERFVGTMFNQPATTFKVALNGKKISAS